VLVLEAAGAGHLEGFEHDDVVASGSQLRVPPERPSASA
jgi:hypothetical protein